MESAGIFISVVAAAVAVASLFYTARAANAAKAQTAIQRQVREDAAQPYVWVDLRPSEEHGQLMLLVVGNSGPTIATNVRVSITPPLAGASPDRGAKAQTALDSPISALAPGRQMVWSLGVAFDFIQAEAERNAYEVVVDAEGPFGPLTTLRYVLDLETIRYNLATPPGTLHGVTKAIQHLERELTKRR